MEEVNQRMYRRGPTTEHMSGMGYISLDLEFGYKVGIFWHLLWFQLLHPMHFFSFFFSPCLLISAFTSGEH